MEQMKKSNYFRKEVDDLKKTLSSLTMTYINLLKEVNELKKELEKEKFNYFRKEQEGLKKIHSNMTLAHKNLLKKVDDLKKELDRSNHPEIAEHTPTVQAGPSMLEDDSNNTRERSPLRAPIYKREDMESNFSPTTKDENSEEKTNGVDGQPAGYQEKENGNNPEPGASVEEGEDAMEESQINKVEKECAATLWQN